VVAQVGHSKSSLLHKTGALSLKDLVAYQKAPILPGLHTHIDHIPFQVLKCRYMPSVIKEAHLLDLRIDTHLIMLMPKGEVLIRKMSLQKLHNTDPVVT
jgi:hypothetical protein